ncbi:MAG: aminomethyl transferase family protein [Chloroflexi bacterium]|jgi:folate-binding protein YgfZ|nr:aminomethyl transferase family protein [Chloroflexota bacterium]
MAHHSADLPGYEQALQGAVYFRQPSGGYFEISGEDRIGFLQRQTSNDIRRVGPGRGVLTVLTSPAARILDVLFVFEHPQKAGAQTENQTLSVLTLPGSGERTASFLRSRIFFNDRVEVRSTSDRVTQIELLGPKAADLLNQLGLERMPGVNEILEADLDGLNALVIAAPQPFCMGFLLLVLSERADEAVQRLSDAGAQELSPEAQLVLRIEAGQPAAGYELTEDYTPLETGLRAAVSDNKGCYTGQEVIARQITYDKITQSLVGLKLEGPVDPQDTVWVEGKAVGKVTSAVVSPRLGPVALAVLRRPNNEPGTRVAVGSQIEEATKGVVTALPFSEAQT